MNLNLSAPAVKGATIRLVYKITTPPLAGAQQAREMADHITAAWQNAQGAFVVRAASEPVQGGAPGSGVFGVLAALWGVNDYGTAIDIKTNHDLASMSWQELISPLTSFGDAFFDGPLFSARFDHAELVQLPTAPATSGGAGAQQSAAQRTAQQSAADAVGPQFFGFAAGLAPMVLVLAAIGVGVAIYLRSRRA